MAATDTPQVNLRKASRKLLAVKRNLLWGRREDLAVELQALYEKICSSVDWSPENEPLEESV